LLLSPIIAPALSAQDRSARAACALAHLAPRGTTSLHREQGFRRIALFLLLSACSPNRASTASMHACAPAGATSFEGEPRALFRSWQDRQRFVDRRCAAGDSAARANCIYALLLVRLWLAAWALYFDLDVAPALEIDGQVELAAVPTRMKRSPSWNSPD
jgi:hypothetical protein